MNQPFTAEETKSAIRSFRSNRSAGVDQIKAEMLKSAADILHELLANIYNNIVNEEKAEEFTINRNGEVTWKKCKLLGTLLDTEEDVK